MKLLTGLLAGVVLAALTVFFVPSLPAQAASCSGDSCYAKDPNTYCGSGSTLRYHEDPNSNAQGIDAYWQERSGCGARWVRLGIKSGSEWYLGVKFQGRIQSQRIPRGESNVVTSTQDSPIITPTAFNQSKTEWSKMVSVAGSGGKSRFCWRTTFTNNTWSSWSCSSYK